jgi:hypothetical protein
MNEVTTNNVTANNEAPNNLDIENDVAFSARMHELLRALQKSKGRHSKQRRNNGAFGNARPKVKGVWRPLI